RRSSDRAPGSGFCDVVLGWDVKDQLYDNPTFTGWHTAYPDAPVRILPHSCREVPFENGMLLFLGEFAEQAEAVCPRNTLLRVIRRCQEMGFDEIGRASCRERAKVSAAAVESITKSSDEEEM